MRRKCNFDVVFFESNADLCVPPTTCPKNKSKYHLARRVIFAHLYAHLPTASPDTKVFSFESIQDAAFKAYLKSQNPYFIMCHDGAAHETLVSLDIGSDNANAMNSSSNEEEMARKTRLRTMIFDFLAQGYNAALVNGLDWVDTKVPYASLVLNFR